MDRCCGQPCAAAKQSVKPVAKRLKPTLKNKKAGRTLDRSAATVGRAKHVAKAVAKRPRPVPKNPNAGRRLGRLAATAGPAKHVAKAAAKQPTKPLLPWESFKAPRLDVLTVASDCSGWCSEVLAARRVSALPVRQAFASDTCRAVRTAESFFFFKFHVSKMSLKLASQCHTRCRILGPLH